MSVTNRFAPSNMDPNLEDYKNELKQCLRENIQHKREIKQLRQQKKESDAKLQVVQQELDDSKIREAAEVQKAVKRVDTQRKQLQTKLDQMKVDYEELQKVNSEFKEYTLREKEKIRALRNVNTNLNKKLHQRFQGVRKDPSFQEVEQQWQHAEARSQDLE